MKTPPVTSSVRSPGSTPIRQEAPIAIWAAKVPAIPTAQSANPPACAAAASNSSQGWTRSARASTGLIPPRAIPAKKTPPPISSIGGAARRSAMPVLPVVRRATAILTPKASTR